MSSKTYDKINELIEVQKGYATPYDVKTGSVLAMAHSRALGTLLGAVLGLDLPELDEELDGAIAYIKQQLACTAQEKNL